MLPPRRVCGILALEVSDENLTSISGTHSFDYPFEFDAPLEMLWCGSMKNTDATIV
jgi:hypothetical protein